VNIGYQKRYSSGDLISKNRLQNTPTTGSEDGKATTVAGVMFAHGTETPYIGWGDPELLISSTTRREVRPSCQFVAEHGDLVGDDGVRLASISVLALPALIGHRCPSPTRIRDFALAGKPSMLSHRISSTRLFTTISLVSSSGSASEIAS
jgi:hypothetical protein